MTTTSSSSGSALLISLGILVIFLFVLYSVIASAVKRGVREGMLQARADEQVTRTPSPRPDDPTPRA